MKRFTNPPNLTCCPSSVLIKPTLPKASRPFMQAQQSLFQSAFKDPNQRTAHGLKKSIPFLNLWAPSQDVQRYQEQQKRYLNTMASATSFYDFKPLDSKASRPQPQPIPKLPLSYGVTVQPAPQSNSTINAMANHSSTNRKRRRRPSRHLQRKGRPDRQHGLEMRLHAPVRGPRVAVQEDLRLAPRPVHHSRFSV
jgi:hypothetical protein